MTIDLSGCSAERKAAINSRTYAGARVAYKALTGPLDPVNEGSFRALKVIIPEGNVMMAQFPAPMSGWSCDRTDRRRHHRPCARECDAGPGAGRPSRPTRRLGSVLRHASQDQAALRRAEHRGRRLGRTAVRGWRSRRRSRSARATCATVRSRVSSSSVRWWSRAGCCGRIPAARGNTAAVLDSTPACATWSKAAGISSIPAAASVRRGGSPAVRRASRGLIC